MGTHVLCSRCPKIGFLLRIRLRLSGVCDLMWGHSGTEESAKSLARLLWKILLLSRYVDGIWTVDYEMACWLITVKQQPGCIGSADVVAIKFPSKGFAEIELLFKIASPRAKTTMIVAKPFLRVASWGSFCVMVAAWTLLRKVIKVIRVISPAPRTAESHFPT